MSVIQGGYHIEVLTQCSLTQLDSRLFCLFPWTIKLKFSAEVIGEWSVLACFIDLGVIIVAGVAGVGIDVEIGPAWIVVGVAVVPFRAALKSALHTEDCYIILQLEAVVVYLFDAPSVRRYGLVFKLKFNISFHIVFCSLMS